MEELDKLDNLDKKCLTENLKNIEKLINYYNKRLLDNLDTMQKLKNEIKHLKFLKSTIKEQLQKLDN